MVEVGDPSPSEWRKAKFVCQGIRLGSNDDKLLALTEVREDGTANPDYLVFSYTKKKFGRFMLGGVYEMECNDKLIRFGAAKWLERYSNEKEIMEWQILQREAETKERRLKIMEDEMSLDSLGRVLDPIGKIYRNKNGFGRATIEVMIIDYLRKNYNY